MFFDGSPIKNGDSPVRYFLTKIGSPKKQFFAVSALLPLEMSAGTKCTGSPMVGLDLGDKRWGVKQITTRTWVNDEEIPSGKHTKSY
jgi:hypothetical protein